MEETIDPTVKLTKFLKEDKLEDAFHMALSADDVDLVAWLCNQVIPSFRETRSWGHFWELGCVDLTAFKYSVISVAHVVNSDSPDKQRSFRHNFVVSVIESRL